MELTSPKVIKELLSANETKPSKGLGQNFLIDKNILQKIIDASDIKLTDTILEVGPGIGTLTQELAKKAKQIISVEKDRTMIEILKETLKDFKNVEVVEGDILKFSSLPKNNYKVVANIPYYLTSPLIRKFLEEKNQPTEIILMVQKEVAQRICPPRLGEAGAKMNLLAISVQFYADPKIISYVSKNCFFPAPKIDSAIIKIIPARNASRSDAGGPAQVSTNLFFKVVKAGFSHPRKQLANNFSNALNIKKEEAGLWLQKNNLSEKQRAETLSVQDWINLAKTFNF